MAVDLQKEAEKELKRIDDIIPKVELLKPEGKELLLICKSYHEDARFFFNQQKFLQAFEAAVICWAYIDAGIHLGVFKVPPELSRQFTV
jgi:hypothetical protein